MIFDQVINLKGKNPGYTSFKNVIITVILEKNKIEKRTFILKLKGVCPLYKANIV